MGEVQAQKRAPQLLPPLHLFLASPPGCDAAQTGILCFPALFSFPEPGQPSSSSFSSFSLSYHHHHHCRRPGPGCSPAGPRGGFSESVTVSAESLAARANGRTFFNQLKLHFLQISLPLSAAKKITSRTAAKEKKKKKIPKPTQHPPQHPMQAAKSPHKLAG